MGFPERLQSIIEERNTTMYQISKDTGIAKSTIANYLAGKTQPNQNILIKLCEYLLINKEWLIDGSGNKYTVNEETADYNRLHALKNNKKGKHFSFIVDELISLFLSFEDEIEQLKKENEKLQEKAKKSDRNAKPD